MEARFSHYAPEIASPPVRLHTRLKVVLPDCGKNSKGGTIFSKQNPANPCMNSAQESRNDAAPGGLRHAVMCRGEASKLGPASLMEEMAG